MSFVSELSPTTLERKKRRSTLYKLPRRQANISNKSVLFPIHETQHLENVMPPEDVFSNSSVFKHAENYRNYARNYKIGSSQAEDDLYISNFLTCNASKKRDVFQVPSLSLTFTNIFSSVTNTPSQCDVTPQTDRSKKLSLDQIGTSAYQLEKVFPVPVQSMFLYPINKAARQKSMIDISSSDLSSFVRDDNSTVKLDPDTIGVLLSCFFAPQIKQEEKQLLIEHFGRLSPENIGYHHEKAIQLFYDVMTDKKSSKKQDDVKQPKIKKFFERKDIEFMSQTQFVTLSQYVADFNCAVERVKHNTEVFQEITIKSGNKNSSSVEILIEVPTSPHYTITVTPSAFELKKGSSTKLKLSILLTGNIASITDVVVIEIKGGPRYFVLINAECEKRMFGVDPIYVEMEEVAGYGQIPKVLVFLRQQLEKAGGLTSKGVFRESGHDRKLQELKKKLNKGEFEECNNVNVLANLFKLWFRELPHYIFEAIPVQTFDQLDVSHAEVCQKIMDIYLSEINKRIFLWLIDFLCEVEKYKETNMMPSSNLAIVFAPNLYTHSNQFVILKMTNKITKFLDTVITMRKGMQ